MLPVLFRSRDVDSADLSGDSGGCAMNSEDWRNIDRVALKNRADAGDALAMYNLGVIAYYERDADTAIHWFREAANRGSTDAMYNLGVVLSGQGRSEEAEPWHIKAAEAGNPQAMWNLALMYGLHDRPDLAAYWRERAEATGHGPDDDNTGIPDDVRRSFEERGLPE
jgi:TPR repeat protein